MMPLVLGSLGLAGLVIAAPAPPAARSAAALLGQGVQAVRAGRAREGARALEQALAAGARNADYARYYLAEARFALHGPRAALPGYQAVARLPSSRFAQPAAWRAADCLWLDGRADEAVRRYRSLLAALGELRQTDAPRTRRPHVEPALALYRMAQRAGAETARELYQRLVTDFPSHPLARDAERRLVELRRAGAGAADAAAGLSPALLLGRARTLSQARRWDEALDTLALVREEDLGPAQATERALLEGKTLYQTRKRYDEAARLLASVVDRLPSGEAAWAAFHAARALARADRDDEAIGAFQRMAERFPASSWAAEARYMAGWLEVNRGRFAEGLPALAACVERHPASPFSASALWFLAFSHYMLGDDRAALAALERFARRADLRPELRPLERTRYYRARLLQRLGQTEEAARLYEELARDEPFEWYGLLAAERLIELGRPPPTPPAAAAPPAVPRPDPGRLARDPLLARVDELLAAALPGDAGLELERDARGLLTRLGNAPGLFVLIDRARAAGTYARAHQLAATLGRSALARAPLGADRLIWEAAYPLAYADLVDRHGQAAGTPEHLLHAIMRKESGFDPQVVSYADARGLLQMIPPTSRRVAEEAGLPYADDDLFDPETNIALGARYIGALHRRFGGEAILTFGAYNGGPRAMRRFCERWAGQPADDFVELVTYAQTREYIKRVAANYARYRFLYAGQSWRPALALRCAVHGDGPDY